MHCYYVYLCTLGNKHYTLEDDKFMNNQFTQRVSDIIMYSKEEANRLRNSYIGPEHLLLGLIREGEGKAIEILFNLQINLQDIKNQLETIVKNKCGK